MTTGSPTCYFRSVTTSIENALLHLAAGGVVGLPTETVYGLAARIDRPEGLRRIFAVKERPFFDPLIVHVASTEQARALTSAWPAEADALADAFWPGPLTMILPKNDRVDPLITSGLNTVGLRRPDHPLAQELILRAGPLAAPSANKFGRTSPTRPAHVRAELGESVPVLDGGPSRVGIESTVLAVRPRAGGAALSILRAGIVTRDRIARALADAGLSARFEDAADRAQAPGQMKHHYMPSVPLIWIEGEWTDEEVMREANLQLRALPDEVEGVKIRKPAGALTRPARLRLGNDPAIAARKLYAELRRLAESGADHLIYAADPAHGGDEWAGVLDRLKKASSLVLRRWPRVLI